MTDSAGGSTGRVAIVTGVATGAGRATALKFADAGVAAILVGRRGDPVAALGGLDDLINAAAVGLCGPVERSSLPSWRETIATDLTGVFLRCRAVLASMRARRGGAIVSIGAGAGAC